MADKLELKNHPKTELEYWHAIESVGGLRWRGEHDLSDGRVAKEHIASVTKTVEEAKELSDTLAEELSEKFGVVHIKDTPQVEIGEKLPDPPPGKQWYWDWYNQWKEHANNVRYESEVCSACPYSRGMCSHSIDCSIFQGIINRLSPDFYGCAMIQWAGRSSFKAPYYLEEFLQKIKDEHGVEAKAKFYVKMESIRLLLQSKDEGA